MCGIVAGVSVRNIVPILVQGLQRLEYRGYDSCGIAIFGNTPAPNTGHVQRLRSTARVSELNSQIEQQNVHSTTGIAHTRWATHGSPKVDNAHPHFSFGNTDNKTTANIAVVHNGIIENYEELKTQLIASGYHFSSQTDSEVIAHLLDANYQGDLFEALKQVQPLLKGAYALAAFCKDEPHRVVGARLGSPLIVGIADDESFLASDPMALAGITEQIIFLEEGDIIDLQLGRYWIESNQNQTNFSTVQRPIKQVQTFSNDVVLGSYRHYMQKEIFEQPRALSDTLEGVVGFSADLFGEPAAEVLTQIDNILILSCGTSYYSGCTGKYWLESIAKIPTQVEIASEYRYRTSIANSKTLVIVISQSGETADTLAALRHSTALGMTQNLSICNVASSTMVRESKLNYITRAGVEIGVASTKAFTTQLTALFLLAMTIAKQKKLLTTEQENYHLTQLRHLPVAVQAVLALEPQLIAWSQDFAKKDNAIFLGRGLHYPIAMEGALKLKEISYIHAEGYPAGELKHGPLALITEQMPVVVVAPNDELIDKLKSNMQEVKARGGQLYVLADADSNIESESGIHVIRMPEHYGELSPILHTVALQLLSYHTACAKGTDVDKPRNLAKSVTVE